MNKRVLFLAFLLVLSMIPAVTSTNTNLEWQKKFGGNGDDGCFFIEETEDGGFIASGYTESYGLGKKDLKDIYLLKTDSNGNRIWDKTFGGIGDDRSYCIRQDEDGGYIIAGATNSTQVGSTRHTGGAYDAYIIKTDSEGNLIWNKTFGKPETEEWAQSIQQTEDGGYIVVGWMDPVGVNVTDAHDEGHDLYLFKLDNQGKILWSKNFGQQDGDEEGFFVQQTSDGGYIITGLAEQSNSKGTRHGMEGRVYDIYLIKTDHEGDKLWEKKFGGSGDDWAWSVQETKDKGFFIAGATSSQSAGKYDMYMLKTDSQGNKQWDKKYGGKEDDQAYAGQQTADGGYILFGVTDTQSPGSYDAYTIKTDSQGKKLWEKKFGSSGSDEVYFGEQNKDGSYIMCGWTTSATAGGYDAYLIRFSTTP